MIAQLRDLRFAFRDKAERGREMRQQMHALAMGGGSTLMVGAILAAATQSFAVVPLALLPICVGLYAAWRGSRDAVRLALEVSAQDDIVGLLDGLIESLRESNDAS